MKLTEYLQREGLSFAEFARKINVQSRMTVARYCRGDRIPTRELMERITLATEGNVTANDFYASAAEAGEAAEAAAREAGA